MVTINIHKKDLWLIIAMIMFLVGVGLVIAYNPDWKIAPVNPAVHGHTSDEIVLSSMTQAEQNAAEAAGNLRTGQMWICSDC